MTNTELIRLMNLSEIHPDDRPEVERIFAVLTEERRVKILSDWPRMAAAIKRNREMVDEQKRLLLGRYADDFAASLKSENKNQIAVRTENEIEKIRSQVGAIT